MDKITTIRRPIDPRYPTNLAISLMALLAFIGVAAVRLAAGLILAAALSVGVQWAPQRAHYVRSCADTQGFQAIFSKNQIGSTGASTSLRKSLPSGRIR